MSHNHSGSASVGQIAGKEIQLFFTSPIAYLFLGAFAAITLFIFFWAEAFFERNIADVKPLFEWMPVLLIFLCSTLSMRMWSEERRAGTLEYLLTRPVSLSKFVIGKFLGCLTLLIIALVITLPLPITVSCLGQLDWGPVWSAYLATILLGGSYLAIGLFVSSRCDNQIVSLICACALSGVFYLLGSPLITNLLSTQSADFMRLLGSGSRFSSITRGVLDLRDLYYYISIIIVFLCLNGFMLEKERWAKEVKTPRHRWAKWATALVVINALLANVWLSQLTSLRVDTTQGKIYTLSNPTHQILDHLQEPLMIQGFFSRKTHPLLAPLVPQIKNLLREYAVYGHDKVRVKFSDPTTNQAAQKQAINEYGIRPVPFQVDNRYQSSVVNSYFDVVISYGDQYKVLSFKDLIAARMGENGKLDVQLRNPEHDITAAIDHVIKDYQSSGNLFDTVTRHLTFTGYISDSSALPKQLVTYRHKIQQVLKPIVKQSNGKLSTLFKDPSASPKLAKQLSHQFGFKPMTTNLLNQNHFYFYMTLSDGKHNVQIPLGNIKGSDFKRNLQAGIKHFAHGFTKTIALVTPGQASPYYRGPRYSQLTRYLSQDFDVRKETLANGHVSGDADLLVIAGENQLNRKQLFAIDQYLMQGGTVITAASPYQLQFNQSGIQMNPQSSLLLKWLKAQGINIGKKLVMDPQNSALPIPVTRNVGGIPIRQFDMIDYPYFADVRAHGLNQHNPITENLEQLTIPWASPISVKEPKGMKVVKLIQSSKGSWLSDKTDVMPQIQGNQILPFTPQGKTQPQLLGVIVKGQFKSYFAGKPSPLAAAKATVTKATQDKKSAKADKHLPKPSVESQLNQSSSSARLIVVSSSAMLRDEILQLTGSANRSRYLNSLKLINNAAHYALDDTALLSIHSRSHFDRTLMPMGHQAQLFWEYLNYALAAILLMIIAIIRKIRRRSAMRRYQQLLDIQE